MEPIAFEKVKDELNGLFKNASSRKVVFWYDEKLTYASEVRQLVLDNAEVIIFGDNALNIKYEIEYLNKEQHYLIYYPQAQPNSEDDWLLDIRLYSQVYFADPVALIMRTLDIKQESLREVIERNLPFFANKQRIADLVKLNTITDKVSEEKFYLSMLSTVTKVGICDFDKCLANLLYKPSYWQDVEKFLDVDMFWNLISQMLDYRGAQNLESLTIQLFLSNLSFDIDLNLISKEWGQVIAGSRRDNQIIFVDNLKKDGTRREEYDSLQAKYSTILNVENLVNEIKFIEKVDTFKSFDQIAIKWIREKIENMSIDYDSLQRVFTYRKKSIWYSEFEDEYLALMHATNYFERLNYHVQRGFSGDDALGFVKNYAKEYYLIDYYYRKFTTVYLRSFNGNDDWDLLAKLVENSYNNIYQDKLTQGFSNKLKKLDGMWIGSHRNTWLKIKNTEHRLYFIISDALRYELAAEIKEELDRGLRGTTQLDFMISELPSVTRVGMACLLPHRELKFENDGSILVDGRLSDSTEKRNTILHTMKNDAKACTFDEINGLTKSEFSQFVAPFKIIYIYHNTIDKIGESDGHKVFSACEQAKDEILGFVKKLINYSASSIAITSDHGFLYRRNKMEEKDKSVLPPDTIESSRRYAVTKTDPNGEYTLTFKMLGQDGLYVTTPFGDNCFKTQGGGINFMHGGSSLQEITVPYLTLYNARSRDESLRPQKVGLQLKTTTSILTSRITKIEFVQTEPVKDKVIPLNVQIYFEDKLKNRISNVCTIMADSEEEALENRIFSEKFTLKDQHYDRNEEYFLVVEDIDEKVNKSVLRMKFKIDLVVQNQWF